MKNILWLFIVCFVITSSHACAREVVIQSVGKDGAPNVQQETSAPVSDGIGIQYEDAVNQKRAIVDDFEDGDLTNRLEGGSGSWSQDPTGQESSCTASVIDLPSPERSAKVLRLDYDVDAPELAQNGFWFALQGLDARPYDRLEFFVRGDKEQGFTTSFKIEIKRFKDENKIEKIVGSYVVKGITDSWQRMSIPLSQFNAIGQWEAIEEIVIIFGDRLCDVTKGTLYIDMVQFVNTGYRGPTAFDARMISLRKTTQEFDPASHAYAEWLTKRLPGFPQEVLVKKDWPKDDRALLLDIARDTWKYFENAIDTYTALPLDHIVLGEKKVWDTGLSIGDYTNVTNIGVYFMAVVAAHDFSFITKDDARSRIDKTLAAVERLETYQNFLFNYYDTTTAERTSNFVSLVDSGWLALGIMIVKNAFSDDPALVARCERLLAHWNFKFFYDEAEQLFYHGYFTTVGANANYHYGTLVTEPRIISYLAVARGDVPVAHWATLSRTLPETYTWQQQTPRNRVKKMFRDVSYFGGHYEWENTPYVPSWGGSLFEVLMPTILLNEKELAPESLGLNDKRHAEIHASYATKTLQYPIWGMSPCSVPGGGYSEFGVPFLGVKGYKVGVVTPHVSFLALDFIPEEAIKNIRTMLAEYQVYGEYGFYDAVDPLSKKVAHKYLCLDQAMTFVALDNYLNNGAMRKRFHQDPVVKSGEYLLTEEELFK